MTRMEVSTAANGFFSYERGSWRPLRGTAVSYDAGMHVEAALTMKRFADTKCWSPPRSLQQRRVVPQAFMDQAPVAASGLVRALLSGAWRRRLKDRERPAVREGGRLGPRAALQRFGVGSRGQSFSFRFLQVWPGLPFSQLSGLGTHFCWGEQPDSRGLWQSRWCRIPT